MDSDEGNLDKIGIDSTLAQQFDLIQLNKKRHSVTATIFDPLLERYRNEQERRCSTIVNHVNRLLERKCRPYIKEK